MRIMCYMCIMLKALNTIQDGLLWDCSWIGGKRFDQKNQFFEGCSSLKFGFRYGLEFRFIEQHHISNNSKLHHCFDLLPTLIFENGSITLHMEPN